MAKSSKESTLEDTIEKITQCLQQPIKTTYDFKNALASFEAGDFNGALEAIKKCCSGYEQCAFYHQAEAFIHYKIALEVEDSKTRNKHLQEAAVSARKSSELLPTSIELARFFALMLYGYAGYDQESEDTVEQYKDNQEIEEHKQLVKLIKEGEDKRWISADSNRRFKARMEILENRFRHYENGMASLRFDAISRLEKKRKNQGTNFDVNFINFDVNFIKGMKAKYMWNIHKNSLLKVNLEELKSHLSTIKEGKAIKVLLEAIGFYRKWKTWQVWECSFCSQKVADGKSWEEHAGSHWEIDPDLLRTLPAETDVGSQTTITQDEWEPVDIDTAINTVAKRLLICSDLRKKLWLYEKWPLAEDSQRRKCLQKVQAMFRLLLRNKYLTQDHVDWVIQFTVDNLSDKISDVQLRNAGLKTLKLVCFLGSSQLKNIHRYLQRVFKTLGLNENSEVERLIDAESGNPRDFDIKKDVVFSEDILFLCLDEQSLPREKGQDFLSWLCASQEIGLELESWTTLRCSHKRQAKGIFEIVKEELLHLSRMCARRSELPRKMKAIKEVKILCNEAIMRRQKYASWFREWLQESDAKNDTSMTSFWFELGFLLNVLEINQSLSAHQFEFKSRRQENLSLPDNCLEEKLIWLEEQLLNDLDICNITIKRSIGVVKQYRLQLEKLATYDYQLILLPFLKSFIMTRLVDLVRRDAIVKSLEHDVMQKINKGNSQAKSMHKKQNKKRKHGKEATDSKENNDGKLKALVEVGRKLVKAHLHQQQNMAAVKINVPGIGLKNEDNDCFMNVIIQSLWQLRVFWEQFMRRSQGHKHIGYPCIVCALKATFDALGKAYAANKREAVAATCLKIACSNFLCLSKGEKYDASEFLSSMLEFLRDSFGGVISDFESEHRKYRENLNHYTDASFLRGIFGINFRERLRCVACSSEIRCQKYTSLNVHINACSLRAKKNIKVERPFEEILKLVMEEANEEVTTECCARQTYIFRSVSNLPFVFTMVLGWDRADQSSKDISSTLNALSTELDLRRLLRFFHTDSIYFLVSMVCFSGDREHYICFAYNDKQGKYVQFDDTNVEVTGSWDNVVTTCSTSCLQPTILFYVRKSSI